MLADLHDLEKKPIEVKLFPNCPCECMMTSDKEISPLSLAKMQIANFIVDKFPRLESRKELSGENNRKVTDV